MLKYLPVSQENLKIVNLLSTPDETHLGLIYDWRNGYAVTIDTGWEGQERLLLFVWESCNAWSSAFGEDQWAESLWVRIGAQTNVGDVLGVCYLLVWSGISRWCLLQATGRSLTFSVPGAQGTLTTLLSAERATQQHISISRGFWSVQMMTSWLRWLLNWQRRMLSWNSYFQTKKRMRQGCEGQGLQRYGDMEKSGSCEEGARQIETRPGRQGSRFEPLWGPAWIVVLERRGTVNFQGSPPPRSSIVLPDMEKARQSGQERLLGWSRSSWLNWNIKRKYTRGGRRDKWPHIISEHSGIGLGKQKSFWNWIGERGERLQGGFLELSQQHKYDEGKCGVFTACIKGVTGDTDNTEVLSDLFLWTFAVKTFPQEFQATETSGKIWIKEDMLLVEENQVRKHWMN